MVPGAWHYDLRLRVLGDAIVLGSEELLGPKHERMLRLMALYGYDLQTCP